MSKKNKVKNKNKTKVVTTSIALAIGIVGGTFTGLYYGVPSVRDTINNIGQNTSQEITPPKAPTIHENQTQIKATEIVVEQIKNGEYSLNQDVWQDSNKFSDLEPNKTYHVSIRIKQQGAIPPSEPTTITVTTAKYSQAKSPIVQNVEILADKIIVDESNNKLEYSIDGINYGDSTILTNLQPNTTYNVHVRYKATSISYASEPTIMEYTTPKYTETSTPQITSEEYEQIEITANTVQLPIMPGVEYSVDNGNTWQTNNTLNNLEPNTQYDVLMRYAETDTHYASHTTIISITTEKYEQTTPTITEQPAVTNNTITAPSIQGVEYSIDNGATWQDSNTFTDLSYNTDYIVLIRYAEDNQHYASDVTSVTVRIGKEPQEVPTINITAITTNSIELDISIGAEYSLDQQTWHNNAIIEGLTHNTTYTIYARFPETETKLASEVVSVTATTQNKAEQTISTEIIDSVRLMSVGTNYIELSQVDGVEYACTSDTYSSGWKIYSDSLSVPENAWQSSSRFENLKTNTSYTIAFRLKESDTKLASLPTAYRSCYDYCYNSNIKTLDNSEYSDGFVFNDCIYAIELNSENICLIGGLNTDSFKFSTYNPYLNIPTNINYNSHNYTVTDINASGIVCDNLVIDSELINSIILDTVATYIELNSSCTLTLFAKENAVTLKYNNITDLGNILGWSGSNTRTSINKLILNTNNVVTDSFNALNSLVNLQEVYVADDLVDLYKSSDIWSTVTDKIKPISEYNV